MRAEPIGSDASRQPANTLSSFPRKPCFGSNDLKRPMLDALPLPLAGEGWGGGLSAMDTRRQPPPASPCSAPSPASGGGRPGLSFTSRLHHALAALTLEK